jgi:hypothetical protein
MAEDVSEGRCDAPPYMINITEPVYQAMQGNCFLGQTRLIMFGNGVHAWGGLINPPDSRVILNINSYTVSNYSAYPFIAQIWFNASIQCPYVVSNKVTCSNTVVRPVPIPRVQLQFAESVAIRPACGVNPLNRIISPRRTQEVNSGGEYILPPGGAFLLFLAAPGACLVRARVAFNWWEAPEC